MTLTKEIQQDKDTLTYTGKWHKKRQNSKKATTNPGLQEIIQGNNLPGKQTTSSQDATDKPDPIRPQTMNLDSHLDRGFLAMILLKLKPDQKRSKKFES